MNVSCERCGRVMLAASSCDPDPETSPYGSDVTWEVPERCNDCNVVQGGFHHEGCDLAMCRHGQRLFCDQHE